MVVYGPWTQPPDRTVVDTADVLDPTFGLVEATAEAHVVVPSDLRTVFEESFSVSAATSAPQNPAVYSWAYVTIDPTWYTQWNGGMARHRFNVEPSPVLFAPEAPPGVIGLEYEGGPGFDPDSPFPISSTNPHTITLSPLATLSTDVADETAIDENLTGEWSTKIMVARPGHPSEAIALVDGIVEAGAHVRTLDAEIDLTSRFGLSSTIELWTETFDFVTPADIPPRDGLLSPSFQVRYGWRFQDLGVLLNLTATPPRYRWVFDTVPYRRTSPNDAATEIARRTFPPPRAIQAGRRTSGGYI